MFPSPFPSKKEFYTLSLQLPRPPLQRAYIITTHLRFEEWGDIFGNAKATKAIIDRLTHHCQIIETGNKSFRGAIRCEDKGGKEVKKT
jgi:hypothetical protein